MFLEAAKSIHFTHLEFLSSLLETSKFYGDNVSAFPTLIFFVFSFIVLHSILHRHSHIYCPRRIIILREICFQWAFFYITRGWFLCIKSVKWMVNWSEQYLQVLHAQDKVIWLNHRQIEYSLFFILTCIGMVPFSIFVINCIWKHNMPNFLMWVADDAFTTSELGTSVHYLRRPPNFYVPKRKEYAYRSRRSMSVEIANNPRLNHPPRKCKSMDVIRCNISPNILVH